MFDTEGEIGIRSVRLRMLSLASEYLADGESEKCRKWLLNYLDTVDKESEMGKSLLVEYQELTDGYNKEVAELNGIFDKASRGYDYENITQGLPASDWLEIESKKTSGKYLRELHGLCWNYGNRYDLILKEG